MLDGLLKKQVCGYTQIAGTLTSYNGKPAFFYQKSPMDTDRRWDYAKEAVKEAERNANELEKYCFNWTECNGKLKIVSILF